MSMLSRFAVELSVVTAIPFLVFLWRYRPKSQSLPAPRFVGVGFTIIMVTVVFALCTGVMLPALFPIVMACVAGICSSHNVSARTAMGWIGLTAIALNLGFLGWWGNFVWGLEEQLRKHPIVSLVDRLDYERDVRSIEDFEIVRQLADRRFVNTESNRADLELPSAEHFDRDQMIRLEREISTDVARSGADRRRSMLRSLLQAHQNTSLQFSQQLGFGVGRARVLPYRSWRLDLPEPSSFSLPSSEVRIQAPNEGENVASIGIDFQPWHEKNLINFTNPVTMGLVDWNWRDKRPDLARVVGFRSHAFRSVPEPPALSASENPWQIDALLLMSLLKHRSPMIYVTKELPDMQALAEIPTRALDDFESSALDQLKTGEELVVHGGLTQIRMVGSIRAAAQCLECHQVARGTLLGAFSYRLSRIELNSQ